MNLWLRRLISAIGFAIGFYLLFAHGEASFIVKIVAFVIAYASGWIGSGAYPKLQPASKTGRLVSTS